MTIWVVESDLYFKDKWRIYGYYSTLELAEKEAQEFINDIHPKFSKYVRVNEIEVLED